MYKKRSLFLVIFIITLFSKTTLQANDVTFYNDIAEKTVISFDDCDFKLSFGSSKTVFVSRDNVLKLTIEGLAYEISSDILEKKFYTISWLYNEVIAVSVNTVEEANWSEKKWNKLVTELDELEEKIKIKRYYNFFDQIQLTSKNIKLSEKLDTRRIFTVAPKYWN